MKTINADVLIKTLEFKLDIISKRVAFEKAQQNETGFIAAASIELTLIMVLDAIKTSTKE